MRIKRKRYYVRYAKRRIPRRVYHTEYCTQPLSDFLKYFFYDKYQNFVIKSRIEKFQEWLFSVRHDWDFMDEDQKIALMFSKKPGIVRSLRLHAYDIKNTKPYRTVAGATRPKKWPK